jgi:hypothetical protein
MAVSTVSSLSESFISSVPAANEDGALSKDKPNASQEIGRLAGEDKIMGNDHKLEKSREEESSELTEQSDDGGMLEVHD